MGILSDSSFSTRAEFENVENSVESVKNRGIKLHFEAKLSKFSTMIQTNALLSSPASQPRRSLQIQKNVLQEEIPYIFTGNCINV